MKIRSVIWIAPLLATLAILASGRVASQAMRGPAITETEDGIPVTDDLTRQKCGACHRPDAKGNLSRISWERATPEGWNEAIKRMVRLNGLQISPAETRDIVKYLASAHGLAPEEARSIQYLPEHRVQDETNIPNEMVRTACATCHSFAQAVSWRRSHADWRLLQAMHVALYWTADIVYRRLMLPGDVPAGTPSGPADGSGKPAESPFAADVALDWLTKNAQLHTPEWAAWAARTRAPQLAGRWLVTASAPGHGRFVGEMVVARARADGEFTSTVTLRSIDDGTILKRSGKGIVYGGYAWRGRSSGGGKDISGEAREAMWFAPDQRQAEGRWFWGSYDEFGLDVRLTRASAAPVLLAAAPGAIKAGTSGTRVHLYGDALPAGLTAADVHFGQGVTVTRIVSQSASEVVADVDVAATAVSGPRDAAIGATTLEKALPIYHRVDFVKVTPETSIARLGSETHPKGFQQFEAIAYENGPDGKPHTADDLRIGPIAVSWGIDEFQSSYNDDDKAYVGTLDQAGLFTPNRDGPNPARRFSRNNYGEVWVTATAKAERDAAGKPLSGRSYLVTTVPQYQRWDQPELSK